jgi:hypothetical protein
MRGPIDKLILAHAPREQMAARLAALSVRPTTECLYFGCIGFAGHHVWARTGTSDSEVWRRDAERAYLHRLFGPIDGALCWNSRALYGRDEAEGRAFITHRNGWTALAFWDRSLDKHPSSHSAFLAPGEWDLRADGPARPAPLAEGLGAIHVPRRRGRRARQPQGGSVMGWHEDMKAADADLARAEAQRLEAQAHASEAAARAAEAQALLLREQNARTRTRLAGAGEIAAIVMFGLPAVLWALAQVLGV